MATDARTRMTELDERNAELRQAVSAAEKLDALVLEDAGVAEIVKAVGELTRRSCTLCGPEFEQRAQFDREGSERSWPVMFEPRMRSSPVVAKALDEVSYRRAAIAGPFPELGIRERYLVAAVQSEERFFGRLAFHENAGRFTAFDMLVARHAASTIALQLRGAERAADQLWDAEEALVGEVLRGTRDPGSVAQRAHDIGLDLDSPRLVALVVAPGASPSRLPATRRAAAVLQAHLPHPCQRVLAAEVDEGLALLVPVDSMLPARTAAERVCAAMTRWADEVCPGGSLALAVSSVCCRPDEYRIGYAEAQEVSAAIGTVVKADGHQVTAVDCLGAARMLILTAGADSTRRFLRDTLGPLLDPDDRRAATLYRTLVVFLRDGYSIRACAHALQVHENTVRYRLEQIRRIVGFDVMHDGDARLTLQMAVAVRRIVDPEPSSSSV